MVLKVDEKIIQSVLDDFLKTFEKKREKKGINSFNTPWESYGKLSEEVYEALKDLHSKDWSSYKLELKDIAITALWGLMSIEANEANRNE